MKENYNYKEEDDEIDIMLLINVVINRLPFIAITALVCLIIGAAYILQATPIYQTSTKILVTPLKGSSSMESMFNSNLTSSTKISTEVELIKADSTLERALEKMDLSKYSTKDCDYTQLKSKDIAPLIRVGTKTDTRNTTITVKHSNPQFAADLADAVALAFQDLLSDITKQSSRAQIETIQNQIPVSETQLSDSLAELSDFKSQYGTEQMVNKIKVLTAKIASIQLQKSPLELQKDETIAKLGPAVTLASYPSVDEKIESYSKSVKEYLLYKGVGDDDVNSTRLFALESQINTINQDILTELTTLTGNSVYAKNMSDYICVVARMNVLDEIEKMYSEELASYQVIQGKLQVLQSNVSVNQSLVLSLKSMLEEAKVVESSEQTNVSVIDTATVPVKPIAPQKKKILAVAMLAGIVMSVGYVVLEQLLDNSVKSDDEVRRIFKGDIASLGWIPYVKNDDSERNKSRVVLHSLSKKESYVGERYRVLAANLEYVVTSNTKVLVINSADIGEGKTTITCNLATTLASNGRKVLLIDGDLRRLEMERSFDISRCKKGLTDVLIDGVHYQDCIVKPVKSLDNLHMLGAGHSSRNPNIVFGSKGFSDLIAELRGIYDYIFIDCPPVSFGSDFGIIAKNIDAYMFAIRAGYATREQVTGLIEVKDFIPARLLGYIFYGVLEDKTGYGYGYGYGNSYAGDEKGKKSRFSIRRKVNYKKIRKYELEKRTKSSHIYGTYKAPLAFIDGIDKAFGNLDEVSFMKKTISVKSENEEKETGARK